MGVKETNIVHESQMAASKIGVVLWKNVRGVFRQLRSEARVNVGLGPNGASDTIGYRKVVITQAMVGMTIAQFVCVEFKSANGVERADQQKFIDRINAEGGRAGFARSAAETVALLNKQ